MSGATGDVTVQLEQREGVLIVTIDRPEVRNAIDAVTAHAIADAMDLLDNTPGLSLGVITGAGGTFCTGMDLKAFLAGERPSVEGRGFAGIAQTPPAKPIIAAVEGYAIAGGFEIALACDLIVASHTAKFGLPEVKRGLLAGGGGLLRLPERVPYSLGLEWALTGDFVDAEQARAAGLISRLTEPGEALGTALELAGRIAQNGPLAVRGTKEIMTRSRDWSSDNRFEKMWEIYEPIRSSEDAREGATAFKEKRAPRWQGR